MDTEPIDFANEEGPEQRWLAPLSDDAPCGENLEYDLGYLELTVVAEGTPERQFGDKVIPGEPPDWNEVARLSEELMGRTRDLRIVMIWVRAQLHREQFPSLGRSLRLLTRLLERYWDGLHPRLDPDDDNDPLARLNAIAALAHTDGLLRDILDSVVATSPLGNVTVRDAAIALEHLPAPEGATPYSRGQLTAALADASTANPEIAAGAKRAGYWLEALRRQLAERVGSDRVPDLDPLSALLNAVAALLPEMESSGDAGAEPEESGATSDSASPGSGAGARVARSAAPGTVQSRNDAMRAIDLVCDFLERTEPTNPAQLLLRRARSLINMNFLELVRELAPGSLDDVAKLMGVSADSVGGGSDSGN